MFVQIKNYYNNLVNSTKSTPKLGRPNHEMTLTQLKLEKNINTRTPIFARNLCNKNVFKIIQRI